MRAKKRVSILRETLHGETRVILLPSELRMFCDSDFEVFVEEGAGDRVGVSDEEYSAIGAKIVATDDAWNMSPLVLKYKAPSEEEFRYLRPGLHLGAVFHAEGNPRLTKELCKHCVTAYSYEFFRSDDLVFPLARPGGEIAGKLAVFYGAYHLQRHLGGSGVLLSPVVGAQRPKVLVIGHGNAGGAAARTAFALGAEVVVFGTRVEHLRAFEATMPFPIRCLVYSPAILRQEIVDSDLVIGAILISSFDTPTMIDDDMIKSMKPGSIIIDVTCGYGAGYMPPLDHPTTFEAPTRQIHGVRYCKIDTLPAAVPVTTVQAMSALVAPYLLKLAQSIYSEGVDDPVSSAGKITESGTVIHSEVLRQLRLSGGWSNTD